MKQTLILMTTAILFLITTTTVTAWHLSYRMMKIEEIKFLICAVQLTFDRIREKRYAILNLTGLNLRLLSGTREIEEVSYLI